MGVVRELDRELPFVFCFRGLIRTVGFSESKAARFPRRGADVTDRADGRAGGHKSLACEKLLAMTTYTSLVVWKVGYIRKGSFCGPFRGNFVAGITSQALVLGGRVKKRRVLCRGTPRGLLLW